MNIFSILLTFTLFCYGCAPHRAVFDKKPERGFIIYIKDYSFVEKHGSIRDAVKFLLKQDQYKNLSKHGVARINHGGVDGAGRIGAYVHCNNARGREYTV